MSRRLLISVLAVAAAAALLLPASVWAQITPGRFTIVTVLTRVLLHASAPLQWASAGVSTPDLRFRRTAAASLTLDDGAGGPADLTVTDLLSAASVQSGTSGYLGVDGRWVVTGPTRQGLFRLEDWGTESFLSFQFDGTPTCSSNCGTSPSVSGSDSSFTVTMGATGSPASGWVITFADAWAAAPQCSVSMALAGMVVGKLPLTVATTTTTMTVVTNGTAPANSDKYHGICVLGA